jgi:hypothetical protein
MWALIRPRRNWFISTGWGWLTKTGVYTSLRRLFSFSQVNECNRDLSPIDLFCDELVRCGLPGPQQQQTYYRVTDTDRSKDRVAFALIAH